MDFFEAASMNANYGGNKHECKLGLESEIGEGIRFQLRSLHPD